jgi:hypothetical protein
VAPDPRQFWAWWDNVRPAFEQAFTGGNVPAALVEELGARVDAVARGLVWELSRSDGEGDEAGGWTLVVGPGGSPELYAVAARLVAAAPGDPGWTYTWLRPVQADVSGIVLHAHGREVRVGETRFGLEERDGVVDVRVDHPALRKLRGQEGLGTAFMLLDTILGEGDVERYVGTVEAGRVHFRAADPAALRAAVVRMSQAEGAPRPGGGGSWSVLKTEREGSPAFITLDRSLRHVDHPLFDVRAHVIYGLLHPNEAGLTTNEEAEQLYALEDALLEHLGPDAILVARQTYGGRRTLILAIDGESTARAWLEQAARESDGRPMGVTFHDDPGWRMQRNLLRQAR